MLLLTDRPDECRRLQQSINAVKPCTVAASRKPPTNLPSPTVIVCDVAFDSVAALASARSALSQLRPEAATPLLCLARDPSQLTYAHARSIGATLILPHDTPHADIVLAIRRLASDRGPEARAKPGESRGPATSLAEAGAALGDLFAAAKQRLPISAATLDRGGRAVIAAVGKAKIRAWLEVVRNYDDVTYQHCLLVAGLAAAFAPRLGLSTGGQRLVSQAALIHDIGKSQIPYGILNKAGELSPSEFTIMRTHAALGYGMLAKQGGFDPRLLDVVRHHHEYIDGSGYPDQLRGGQISPLVRLMTVCDIYAALIERRPYKPPISPQKAFSILLDMGPKLDAGLVGAFESVVDDA